MDGLMNLFGGDMSGLNELLTPEQRAAMQRQGAMSMAAQLLAASGPSRTPVNLGQALGQAYMAGQKGYGQAQQQALTGMMTKQKIQEYKQKLASREAMNKALEAAASGAPAPVAGSLTTAQQAFSSTQHRFLANTASARSTTIATVFSISSKKAASSTGKSARSDQRVLGIHPTKAFHLSQEIHI